MASRPPHFPMDKTPMKRQIPPYHVFGKYRSVSPSETTSWERAALRSAERSEGRGKVNLVRFGEDSAGTPPGNFVTALSVLFRKRVVFVAPIKGGELSFEGMVHPDDLNTIQTFR